MVRYYHSEVWSCMTDKPELSLYYNISREHFLYWVRPLGQINSISRGGNAHHRPITCPSPAHHGDETLMGVTTPCICVIGCKWYSMLSQFRTNGFWLGILWQVILYHIYYILYHLLMISFKMASMWWLPVGGFQKAVAEEILARTDFYLASIWYPKFSGCQVVYYVSFA